MKLTGIRYGWLLIILISLALVIRLINLERDSLWFDESISYLTGTLSLSQIINNYIQDPHPPFYYLLLKLWLQLISGNDGIIRILNVFLNILLIPVVYLFSLELFKNNKISLVAAIFVAISPFHILYSHELRMYSLLMLLSTFMAFSFWKANLTSSNLWWLIFFLSSVLAIYTHLFAFLVLVGIGFFAFIYRKDRNKFWFATGIIFLVCFLFIPWLYLMVSETEQSLGSLRPLMESVHPNFILPLTSIAFLMFGISSTLIYTGLILFVTISIFIFTILEIKKMEMKNIPNEIILLILIIMCVIGIPSVIYFVKPFFLPERTLAAASPFLLILLAWGISRKSSPLPYIAIGSVVLMIIGSTFYLFGDPVKPPYRDSMQLIQDNYLESDMILHTSDGSYLPALRYVEFENHILLAGDPDPRKPESVYYLFGGKIFTEEEVVERVSNRLWLVVALEHSVDWQIEKANYFAEHFQLMNSYDVGGIKIYLYQ